MLKLTQNCKFILDLTAKALFKKQIDISEKVDWQIIFSEARYQSVALLIHPIVKPYLPTDVCKEWELQSKKRIVASVRSEWEHSELHRLMTAASIPYVVMKGCASAAYYPDPVLRTMGDVDFLVHPCDLERAGKVLEQAGYGREKGDDRVHFAYHKGEGYRKTVLEMHWEPNGIPKGKNGDKIRGYLSACISEAVRYETDTGTFMGPSVFHHGLIMLLHTANHMINTGIGLRHLCDWAVFVAALSEDEFCDTFEQKLKAVGLWRFAQILTQLSIVYLNCPEKEWAGEMDVSLLESLMADIFAGGNFGRKDPQRINQAKLMTDKSKGNVDNTSLVKQFCRTMNEKTWLVLPGVKRFPFLWPIGWIYVGIRHFVRIIVGKRPKINMSQVLSGVSERKEIYQTLRLFEEE